MIIDVLWVDWFVEGYLVYFVEMSVVNRIVVDVYECEVNLLFSSCKYFISMNGGSGFCVVLGVIRDDN